MINILSLILLCTELLVSKMLPIPATFTFTFLRSRLNGQWAGYLLLSRVKIRELFFFFHFSSAIKASFKINSCTGVKNI